MASYLYSTYYLLFLYGYIYFYIFFLFTVKLAASFFLIIIVQQALKSNMRCTFDSNNNTQLNWHANPYVLSNTCDRHNFLPTGTILCHTSHC